MMNVSRGAAVLLSALAVSAAVNYGCGIPNNSDMGRYVYFAVLALVVIVHAFLLPHWQRRRGIRKVREEMDRHDRYRFAERDWQEAEERLHTAADMLQGARGTPLEAACRQNHRKAFEDLISIKQAHAH